MKRRILFVVAAFVALLIALPIGALLYIDSSSGRAWLAQTIEEAVSEPGVMELKIGDIAPGLPGDIAIASVTVADRDGVWLTLHDLSVHWDPWSLLSRRLTVDRFELANATISRAPISEAADETLQDEADNALALPSLPVDIVIDDLIVSQLDLGAPLLGEPASLMIDAALSANRSGTIVLDLNVSRMDGVGGTLQAKANIDLAGDQLALSANVHEPADGVIVRMLGLEPYPAFDLTLEGAGPASVWSGQLSANAGDLVAVEFKAQVAAGEQVAVTLEGVADVAQVLPPDVRALVGDAVTLNAAVEIDGESYKIDHLNAETRALAISLDGLVDLSAGTLDARASLTGRDNAPIEALAAPLRLDAWQFNVSAVGSMEAPDLTLNGKIDGLDMPDVGGGDLTVTAEFVQATTDSWRGEAQIIVDGAGVAEPTAQGLLGERVQIDFAADADVDFTKLSAISLVVAGIGLDLRASGDFDLTDLSGEVLADATVVDAAVLSDDVGLPLSGGLRLKTELVVKPDLAGLTGTVNVQGDEFAVDDPSVAPFVGQRLDLETGLDTDLASQVLLDGLTLKTEALDLAGHVEITEGFATLAGRLDGPLVITPAVADLLGVDAGGQALVDARFDGALEDPVVRARAQLENVAAAGISLDGVSLAAELRELAASPTGEALVTLPTSSGPMKIAASFVEADDGAIILPLIALNGAGMTGNGSISLGEDGVAVGSLQGAFETLAPVAGIVDIPANGAATFRIDLADDEAGGQGATLALNAVGLSMVSEDEGLLTVEEVRLQARLADLAGDPSGQADLSLGGAVFDAYVLDGAVVKANLAGDVATVDLQAQGNVGVPVSIDLAVQADMASDDLILVFDRLQGSLGDQPFEQAQGLRVALIGDSIDVQNIALDLGGGEISGNLGRTPQSIEAQVAIERMPISIIKTVVPEADVAGTIDGQINITTANGAVVGTVDVTASDVDLSDGGNQNLPADVVMSADLTERGALAKVSVSGLPGSELDGDLRIGAAIDAATLEARNATAAPLEATLDVNVNLASLWENLPVSDQRMSGNLVAEMTATGTVGDPRVAGQVTLGNGTYEHLVYGTLIDQINLTVTGDSTSNLDIAMQARDGGSGTIQASGDIELGDEIAIQANLSLNNATLVRRDDVTASTAGDISYSGSTTDGLIEGTITTNTVEINLVNSLPPSVVDLEAQDVFGDKGNGQATGGASLWIADLDIAIDMPRRVFVRGRGVDTEWFGKIAITGTTDKPVIDGKIEIQRGQISLIGRVFQITQGVVELDPDEPDNPSLNIAAQSQRGDVTGIITISGRALDPTIEITSIPSLPQAEVLPRVLFGKSSSNLSAFEAFELASAVGELSGIGGGSGIIDQARQALGVDVLRVGSDDDGNTTVGAGSYVTEDVYVGVEQGTANQSGSVKVEVEVTDDITVETSTGADSSANVGVNWRWDY